MHAKELAETKAQGATHGGDLLSLRSENRGEELLRRRAEFFFRHLFNRLLVKHRAPGKSSAGARKASAGSREVFRRRKPAAAVLIIPDDYKENARLLPTPEDRTKKNENG